MLKHHTLGVPMSKELSLWMEHGAVLQDKPFTFGPYFSYQLRKTPRHILFALSRYKFAQKMIGPGKTILELGCSEGLGAHYLAEFSSHTRGIDFDERAIRWAKSDLERDTLKFDCDDFIGKTYGQYDAIVSFDVIEHIYEENAQDFVNTVTRNLKPLGGVALIGTPNLEAEKYSSTSSAGGHTTVYSHDSLRLLLEQHFHNVFIFSMNDEVIHTGFAPMAQYLLALCAAKKHV